MPYIRLRIPPHLDSAAPEKRWQRRIRVIPKLLASLLCIANLAVAQTASLMGAVKDPQEATVPSAVVTVTDIENN